MLVTICYVDLRKPVFPDVSKQADLLIHLCPRYDHLEERSDEESVHISAAAHQKR
jgi:hypothetical protein